MSESAGKKHLIGSRDSRPTKIIASSFMYNSIGIIWFSAFIAAPDLQQPQPIANAIPQKLQVPPSNLERFRGKKIRF
jgi:hypothetical protein